MPDQTARDAVAGVILGDPDAASPMRCWRFTYGCRLADAVLAVLGIPPDTTIVPVVGLVRELPPRDDEARIERAALAALDGILIALGWALDDVEYPKALNAARAALAAADQEEKP